MKRLLIVAIIATVLTATPAAGGPPSNAPCRERSWIPRTGMPTAEKHWRLVRLVDCAVTRWWPGAGHAASALAISWREASYNTFAVNWGGCNGNNCYGAWQHSGAYLPGRFAFYLHPEWFRHWPVAWTNARAQTIVTIRMMAAQGGVCPAWC